MRAVSKAAYRDAEKSVRLDLVDLRAQRREALRVLASSPNTIQREDAIGKYLTARFNYWHGAKQLAECYVDKFIGWSPARLQRHEARNS